MKASKDQIDKFLEPKKLAIAGVSRNEKKFGYLLFKELRNKNFEVLPINPNTEEIDGVKCYKSIEDIPQDVSSLLIATSKRQTDEILRGAIKKGIDNIWIQQSCETNDTLKIAEENQKQIIHNKCMYMFAEPIAGIHKFHRTIVKIFGGLPK
jgi:uncharacterized protein